MNVYLLSESLALLLKERYDTDYLSERPAKIAERTRVSKKAAEAQSAKAVYQSNSEGLCT